MSFVHRLVREVPGFAKFLHVYGNDSEEALINSLAAGFQCSSHLLCYIHCKKNVQQKMKQIGLSEDLAKHISSAVFGKSGLAWSASAAEFEQQVKTLVKEWDDLEQHEQKESHNSLLISCETSRKT